MAPAPPAESLRRIARAFVEASTVCDGTATDYARPRVRGGDRAAGNAPRMAGGLERDMADQLEQFAAQIEHHVARYRRGPAAGPGPDATDAQAAEHRIRSRGVATVVDGDHIRLKRARGVMTQKALAARAGTTQKAVSRFETGAEKTMPASLYLELLRAASA